MALRFEVKRPGIQWVNVAADLATAAAGGGVSNYSGKAKVIVFNGAGKHRVLESVDSEREAEERMSAIQRDSELLSTSAWCEKYDVPLSFAQG
jgi:hypothetical protein